MAAQATGRKRHRRQRRTVRHSGAARTADVTHLASRAAEPRRTVV